MKKQKKLTKLLSVFALAGAMTASIGALSACGHEHTFSSDWAKDETGHWHEATCDDYDGEKNSFGVHVDEDKNFKCDVCEWDMTPAKVEVTSVALDKNEAKIKPGQTLTLTATVAPENATDKTVTWKSSDDATATVADGLVTAVKEGEVTITATAGAKSATCKVTVSNVSEISTVEQFLEFRNTENAVGTYKLVNDIDLTGVALESPKVIIGKGVVFDGNGFTVSNATLTNADAKVGILSAQVTGGTVTNVKFLNCVITSANETDAIVTGLCEGGTLSKIEFNSCSATTTSTYAGLLFGRNTKAGDIRISEITAKNGCMTSCSQYGGLLVGDMVKDTTVQFRNLHIDGEFKGSSGNGSFIAGRTRDGAVVSVVNAVIKAKIPQKNSLGLFSGGGACANLVLKNILIIDVNEPILYHATKAPKVKSFENVAALEGVELTLAEDETVGVGQNTVAYLKDTLGFDFTDVWMQEGDGYRLKAASTNVKSEGATISSIKVNSANAKTRFKKGEEFTAEGLSVMGVYSDGVQLVLNGTTGFEIDSSAFNKDAKGEYTITVKSREDATKTQTYKVSVAEEEGFVIYDEFMAHTYMTGATLDKGNLVVKSVWSDGIEEKVTNFTLSEVDMTTAGAKEITVTYGSYAVQKINISVQATKPVPVDGKIYVNVDSASEVANGAQVNGVETFKTVADAIDYLEACGLEDSVVKVVNIKAGTYKAKITTSLANLTLVGENKETTVLTYSAVESTVNVVSGSQFGLDCATLKVSGEGFSAHNLSIRNDFNYIENAAKESSPQGLALTIDGDKAVISNCILYGNQDTLFLRSGRAYFKETLIQGNVDFIFGEATGLAFFENCEIKSISRYADSVSNKSNNGYVTAMRATEENKPDYGYIFSGCKFTDDGKVLEGAMSLGRPWGAKATVAYINCSFTKAYAKAAYGATVDGKAVKSRWADMSGNLPEDADFVEYGSTGEGAITASVKGGKVITEAEAAKYTKANIFAAKNGKAEWSAAWDCDAALTAQGALLTTTETATGIFVSSESVSVEVGESKEVLVSRTPWNLKDKRLTITVEDNAVATFTNGVLKGVKEGTTKITVTDGTTTKEIAVTVTPKTETITPHTHTFSYAGIDATGFKDKQVLTSENFTEGNAFLSVAKSGAVTWRQSNSCIENKDDGLAVTFNGTGTVTITCSSTGGSNKSRIGVQNASGAYVEATTIGEGLTAVSDAEAGAYEFTGTTQVTITFTVTVAGTYKIVCPSSVTGRGARIMGVVMVDNFAD